MSALPFQLRQAFIQHLCIGEPIPLKVPAKYCWGRNFGQKTFQRFLRQNLLVTP